MGVRNNSYGIIIFNNNTIFLYRQRVENATQKKLPYAIRTTVFLHPFFNTRLAVQDKYLFLL